MKESRSKKKKGVEDSERKRYGETQNGGHERKTEEREVGRFGHVHSLDHIHSLTSFA